MSVTAIAIVAGAYVFMLVLILSLLTSSKRGEQAAQRAVERERDELAARRKRRDAA
jgi:hypothetical protein